MKPTAGVFSVWRWLQPFDEYGCTTFIAIASEPPLSDWLRSHPADALLLLNSKAGPAADTLLIGQAISLLKCPEEPAEGILGLPAFPTKSSSFPDPIRLLHVISLKGWPDSWA